MRVTGHEDVWIMKQKTLDLVVDLRGLGKKSCLKLLAPDALDRKKWRKLIRGQQSHSDG